MHLFELPLEILRSIMEALVVSDLQQALQARLVCSKQSVSTASCCSSLIPLPETFSTELIRAVCATRILETPAYETQSVHMSVLSEYLFTLVCNDASGCLTAKHISQTVDYILEQMPEARHNRQEYIRSLCHRAVESFCSTEWRPFQYNNKSFGRLATQIVSGRELIFWNHHATSENILQNALPAATCLGLTSLAKKMIANGAKDTASYFGTSLFCAVKRDDVELTALLLESGGSELTWQSLQQAARNGNEAMLQLLLDSKYKENGWKSTDFQYAIEGAAARGDWSLIEILIQRAISDGELEEKKPLMIKGYNGGFFVPVYDVVLISAVFHGNQDVAQAALDHGASPAARPRPIRLHYYPVLVMATMNGYEEIVRLLLDRGLCESKFARFDLRLALGKAIQRGWLSIVQLLVEKGAELRPIVDHTKYGYWREPTLSSAVHYTRVDILEYLLDSKSADLGTNPDAFKVAYELAVSRGHTSIAHQFVHRGLVAEGSSG